MPDADAMLQQLREAYQAAPGNLPLCRLLADGEQAAKHYARAEDLWRELLRQQPEVAALPLAQCLAAQGKGSEAIVLLEHRLQHGLASSEEQAQLIRCLLEAGEAQSARRLYRALREAVPNFLDEGLAGRFGAAEEAPADPGQDLDCHLAEAAPTLRFTDVGGMEAVKRQVRLRIIQPLQQPELYAKYGKKSGGGILMYGPPGCGKTMLARATAGEVQAQFFSVGIHDILNRYIGESENRLHEVFELARNRRPSVLFFDEVDALAGDRREMTGMASRPVVNQFLTELDSTQERNDGVLVLGATNAPWFLDPAFRRPGRFDRVLFVPPPDLEAREAILRGLLAEMSTSKIDYGRLAKRCDGYSGADLLGLVDIAVENCLEAALEQGAAEPVTMRALQAAAKEIAPSTKEWFAQARNHAIYANHGGQYDDLVAYLKLG